MLADASGLRPGDGFRVVFSPERVLAGRVFADLRRYPKLVGGVDGESGKRGVAFYEEVLEFDDRPDLTRPNGVWDLGTAEAAELAKLAETTFRDVNIGLANQFARFAGGPRHRHPQSDRGVRTPSRTATSIGRASPSGATASRSTRGCTSGTTPRPASCGRRATANEAMPGYAVDLLGEAYGDLAGARVVVLGASYRGGVKEMALSGVFPTVAALVERGAAPLVHDPMFSDDELRSHGFAPYHYGEPADAVVVQADHAEYRDARSDQFPGVKVLIDGRNVTGAEAWPGVTRRLLGVG